MNKIKIILFLIAGIVSSLVSAMSGADLTAAKDSISLKLSQARTPQDSIPLLYHLMDLDANGVNTGQLMIQLINTADRAHDYTTELDALRLCSNQYITDDSVQQSCLKQALKLPPSNGRSETITFIKVTRATYQIRISSESEKSKAMQQLIANYKPGNTGDLYEEVYQLYLLCTYLSSSSSGELYAQYWERLGELIEKLPADGRIGLPNRYYTTCAIFYTANDDHQKAIDIDKKLLANIESLIVSYQKKGRIYRNYDSILYNIYRRILSNYPALNKEEIEDYYQKIVYLAKHNEAARSDFNTGKRPQVYYYMATHQYAKALPIINETYESIMKKGYQMKYLQYKIEAAKALKDYRTLLQATVEYNDVLKEYNSSKAAEKYKELQILYDVDELKSQNNQLELEKREMEINSSHLIIRLTLIAISVLLVLLVILFWLYHRSMRLTHNLQASKERLQEERKVLLNTQQELTTARDQAENANRMKTLFIQNMSHEIRTPLNAIVGFSQVLPDMLPTDAANKQELQECINLISHNSDLLLTLVGDILDIARMESGEMKTSLMPCSVQLICNTTLDSVADRAKTNVKMYFKTNEPDLMLTTDPTRMGQVLTNFLTNAAKFTYTGEIVLSYMVDHEHEQVIFSVTDTGIGIPADKAEIIFERFEKLDSFVQGTGLGLHICKLIAQMLGGEVYLDTTYTKGARFIFKHPIR